MPASTILTFMNPNFPKLALKGLVTQSRQRDLLVLLGVSLIWRVATAVLIYQPGYIDGAYYFDVARNWPAGMDSLRILSSPISLLQLVWSIPAICTGCH